MNNIMQLYRVIKLTGINVSQFFTCTVERKALTRTTTCKVTNFPKWHIDSLLHWTTFPDLLHLQYTWFALLSPNICWNKIKNTSKNKNESKRTTQQMKLQIKWVYHKTVSSWIKRMISDIIPTLWVSTENHIFYWFTHEVYSCCKQPHRDNIWHSVQASCRCCKNYHMRIT